jgi:hypothetical protein
VPGLRVIQDCPGLGGVVPDERVTQKIRVTLEVNTTLPSERSDSCAIFAALIAQHSCAPTEMAAPVGAQLRWAMGAVRRLSRSIAALLQKWQRL